MKNAATQTMGSPTLRRHSSISTSVPMMPTAVNMGSFILAARRMFTIFWALKQYQKNAPAPSSISTMSYQGMWLGLTFPFLAGKVKKPMMMIRPMKLVRRTCSRKLANSVT